MSDLLIRPHQILTCPKCRTVSEFRERLYDYELPVNVRCPKCPWFYYLSDDTRVAFNLPKRDPRINTETVWVIDHEITPVQGKSPETVDGHNAINKEIENIPPELRTRGIHERIQELSSMMLIMKRVQYSILRDFRTVCDAFVDEVNAGISPYAYMRGAIDANSLASFLERPFMVLPMDFADETLQKLARLVAAPLFYIRYHGIPVGNGHGFNMQLLCPYAEIGDRFPVFLRKMLGLPDPPDIEVLDRKVVGPHINYIWKDVPGLEPDIDHADDRPSLRMTTDTSRFRQWAAKWGVLPWRPMLNRHDPFYESRLTWVGVHYPAFRKPLERLVNQGRTLYSSRDRSTRLRMIGAAVQSLQARSILIHGIGETISWPEMGVMSGTQVLSSNLVTMSYDEFLRGDYADQGELIIAEADKPYSDELLPALYRHNQRLLLVTGDPLFDTLEANTYAPVVYGLVNSVSYDHESFFGPRIWHKDSAILNEKLVEALRVAGFVE